MDYKEITGFLPEYDSPEIYQQVQKEKAMNTVQNPAWWKPAIPAHGHGGCLCCPGTADILPLDVQFYNGFGGWTIYKNGELFYEADVDDGWDNCKNLEQIESEIGEDAENEWTAVLFLPLRGATYQRHSKNNWVLIDKNMGFA